MHSLTGYIELFPIVLAGYFFMFFNMFNCIQLPVIQPKFLKIFTGENVFEITPR